MKAQRLAILDTDISWGGGALSIVGRAQILFLFKISKEYLVILNF